MAATAMLSGLAFSAGPAGAGEGEGLPDSYNDVMTSYPLTVNGDYEPLIHECGSLKILWYAAGPAADHLWTFIPSEGETPEYTSAPTAINGVYDPIIGDFDGDSCDDIVWYAPGSAADFIWWGGEDGFTSEPLTINGTYEAVAGAFSTEYREGIFWYSPGTGAEYFWSTGGDRTFESKQAPSVNGTYRIAANGRDVLFHRPGPGLDYLWDGVDAENGTVDTVAPFQINGTYEPSAGVEGFLLYGPGSAPDHLLLGLDDGDPVTIPATINGVYETGERTAALHFLHLWHAPGSAPDYLWVFEEGR